MQTAAAATEAQLLATFDDAFAARDPAARVAALVALGQGTQVLADKGASKAVARGLVRGLEDGDIEVQNAAVGELAYGRHVETTIQGLDACFGELLEDLERHARRDDRESRDVVSRGAALLCNGAIALSSYRDDRSVATFAKVLEAVPALEERGVLDESRVGQLAASALELGSLEVASDTVELLEALEKAKREPAARAVNDALVALAAKLDAAAPEWSQTGAAGWRKWLVELAGTLPKRLGRNATPPKEPPNRGMEGLPGKSGD